MLGMMLSDEINGLFVSTLIQRADRLALVVLRGLGLTISLFSLGIGVLSSLEFIKAQLIYSKLFVSVFCEAV